MKIVLIVVGAVILLGIVAVQVIKRKVVQAICRLGAYKIHGELEKVFAGEHAFRAASREEFTDLDFAGYDAVRDVLEGRGLRYLGAVEDLTVTEVHPEMRTLIELYGDAMGTCLVSTYHVQENQISEAFSDLEDGRALLTTNAEIDKLTPPPFVDRQVLSAATPVATIVSTHEDRLAAKGMPRPRTLGSFEAALQVMRRYTRAVSDYRKSIGLLTETELHAMVSEPGESQAATLLWREFQKVSREGKQAA